MRAPRTFRSAAAAALALMLLVPALAPRVAHAELGSPDASWRDATLNLRDAGRDTVDHPGDATRLVSLGQALLRMGREADAERILRRALAIRPADHDGMAALGRIALLQSRLAEAESLLTLAGDAEGAPGDLYRTMLRRHEWAAAAERAEAQGEAGRRELLEKLASLPAPAKLEGPDVVPLVLKRAFPVPLLSIKVNGRVVLAALDPGATELLLDPSLVRLMKLPVVPGERNVGWNGTRVSARNAMVPKLELGAYALADVPAAVTPLHRFSLDANPQGPDVQAIVGLPVLERFLVTLDLAAQKIELRRPDAPAPSGGAHVPLERWGENEMMVWGSIAGGRRMAFWVGSGLPNAGLGAPKETFDEVGLQAGKMANLVRGMGTMLQGRPWTQVLVPTISVGSVVQGRLPGWNGAMDSAELWRWGVRRDAVLGPRFYDDRRVTFDFTRREMVFEER